MCGGGAGHAAAREMRGGAVRTHNKVLYIIDILI